MRQRPSARILIIDQDNRLLLFNFKFNDGALAGQGFWATPGGGLENGETYKQAAQRELFEETGLTNSVGEKIANGTQPSKRQMVIQYMLMSGIFWFAHLCSTGTNDGYSDIERRQMVRFRWWSIDERVITTEQIYPENLISMLKSLS